MSRSHHGHHCQLAATAAGCALCLPAAAYGAANLLYDGGTSAEQAQVTAALGASSFEWNVLPEAITVHIAPLALGGYATPGNVYVDSALLEAGEFSWGVVQHEFGHEVDFLLLHDDDRARLEAALGAKDWSFTFRPGLRAFCLRACLGVLAVSREFDASVRRRH